MLAIKKSICILIVLVILLLSLTSCGLSSIPRPEIKSGEFNFSFTYEYAGETKTVSGVYVCEYDGIDRVLDGGFHREWSGYIKGGTEETSQEIEELYGLKIVEYKYDEPIENSFGVFG